MTLHVHRSKGCSPAPLANYRKALGVVRLVVEQQANADARGRWQTKQSWLLSKLTRQRNSPESAKGTSVIR